MVTAAQSWISALKVYAHPRVIGMLFLGFSAGLPLLLVFGTLSFWLSEAGIDRATIGHLSWVGLAYGFKWAWSPLVDRMPIPLLTRYLGRRRSWLFLSQLLLLIGLCLMGQNDPSLNLKFTVYLAILIAISSATQDIALDAYRIEAVDIEKQGAMSATYQGGYRLAMICAGAGVLWIAASFDPSEATYDFKPWQIAYTVMGILMLVGMITTLLIQEPQVEARKKSEGLSGDSAFVRMTNWVKGALVSPFLDFVSRYKWQAVLILSFVALYRISDVVMGVMANPFYKEMGFTKDEVASVTKVYGVVMTIVGAAVGGVFVSRFGVIKILFLGGVLSALTNLMFVWITSLGHDLNALILTISADNLSSGIASSAFIAYLSGLTNKDYSATQYALLTSMMLLLPKFIAGFSGDFVNLFGWANFFTGTALIGLPVLGLIVLVSRIKLVSNERVD